jgi:hypothetical protein
MLVLESRENSVAVVARLRDGRSKVRFPGEASDFSPLYNAQAGYGTYPALCWLVSASYFPCGKGAGRKVHQSLQSIAEVKNKWSSVSIYLN